MKTRMNWKVLDWDSQCFNFRVAKFLTVLCSREDYLQAVQEMRESDVRVAYYSIPIFEYDAARIVEQAGGKFACLRNTYKRKLNDIQAGFESTDILSYTKPEPTKELLDLGVICGEHSRFRTDDGFGYYNFEKLYHEWVYGSVNKSLADEILIYVENETIQGMITVGKHRDCGEIGLVGVNRGMRGRKIGSYLLRAVFEWCKINHCVEIQVVTQGENVPACNLYEKFGFLLEEQKKTYHIWL